MATLAGMARSGFMCHPFDGAVMKIGRTQSRLNLHLGSQVLGLTATFSFERSWQEIVRGRRGAPASGL